MILWYKPPPCKLVLASFAPVCLVRAISHELPDQYLGSLQKGRFVLKSTVANKLNITKSLNNKCGHYAYVHVTSHHTCLHQKPEYITLGGTFKGTCNNKATTI